MEMDAKDAPTWDSAECADAWESGYNSALSHPEPGAQETVAIPSEAEPVAWRYRADGETDAPWAYTHKAFKNDAYILEPLYTRPSPSPEQGGDADLATVERLFVEYLSHYSVDGDPSGAAVYLTEIVRQNCLIALRARVAEADVLAYKLDQAVNTVKPMLIARAERAEAMLAKAVEVVKNCEGQLVSLYQSVSPAASYVIDNWSSNRFADGDAAVVDARAFLREAARAALSNQGSSSNG